MTAALVSASAVVFLVLLMALPFDVKSHTAMSVGRFFVVENLSFFGVVSLAFSVTIEEGRLKFNGKPIKKAKRKSEKKQKDFPKSVLFDLNFRSVSVRGAFGNAVDAASTAVVSSAIITIFDLIKNTNLIKSRDFTINFTPIYQKNILDLDLKIRVRVNIFIIIFSILKILRKR